MPASECDTKVGAAGVPGTVAAYIEISSDKAPSPIAFKAVSLNL